MEKGDGNVLLPPGTGERGMDQATEATSGAERSMYTFSGWERLGSNVLGGFGASMLYDPVTPVSIAAGLFMPPAGLIRTFLTEAAISGVGELAAQVGYVKDWQRELGRDYGVEEILTQTGAATVIGGVLGSLPRAYGNAVSES